MTIRPPREAPRRRVAAAALAALALALLAPTAGPRLAQTRGPVEIGRGDPPIWRPAQEGDAIAPGDTVRTGRDGRAELVLPAGSVRLYGDSLLRIPPGAPMVGEADGVELDRGSSLFDVTHREGDRFEVRTPEVVVSIKGTRFLVVADDQAEVAVFRGVVGLRQEQGAAHEMLVREGFAAVGAHGRAFELVWSGAGDPWEAWLEGEGPPRSPGREILRRSAEVDAAKAAGRSASRRDAIEQATRRHPELAERAAKAIARETGGVARVPSEGAPAAPAPDPLVDVSRDLGGGTLEERYVETWLNAGAGGGTPIDLEPVQDALIVNQGGQSWTLTTADLESAVEGATTLPQPLLDAVAGQGGTTEELASRLLGLVH